MCSKLLPVEINTISKQNAGWCLCNKSLFWMYANQSAEKYSETITRFRPCFGEFVVCSKCSNDGASTVFFISVTFMGIYLAFHDGALSIKSLPYYLTPIEFYLPVPLYSFEICLGANCAVYHTPHDRNWYLFCIRSCVYWCVERLLL